MVIPSEVKVSFGIRGNRPTEEISDLIRERLLDYLNYFGQKVSSELAARSPVGATGDLQSMWGYSPAYVNADLNFGVTIFDNADHAWERIMGRGPGGQYPIPYWEGTQLYEWVAVVLGAPDEARWIIARTIADNIYDRGTRRWRGEAKNVLGLKPGSKLDPDSTITDAAFEQDSLILAAINAMIDAFNLLEV